MQWLPRNAIKAWAALLTGLSAWPAGALPVFINEIHYDNRGVDRGEGIEIAGPAGTDLAGWSLVLYNGGQGGSAYRSTELNGVLGDQQAGFGTLAFDFSAGGLQNGPNDGIALVDRMGLVTQFLSYEGTLTALDGPAAGFASTDIGVFEGTDTAPGYSLQLAGTGAAYSDFIWSAPLAASFGSVNTQQVFRPATPVPEPGSLQLLSLGMGLLLAHMALQRAGRRARSATSPRRASAAIAS